MAWELRGGVTDAMGRGQGMQTQKEDLTFIPGVVETKGHVAVVLTLIRDKLRAGPQRGPRLIPGTWGYVSSADKVTLQMSSGEGPGDGGLPWFSRPIIITIM